MVRLNVSPAALALLLVGICKVSCSLFLVVVAPMSLVSTAAAAAFNVHPRIFQRYYQGRLRVQPPCIASRWNLPTTTTTTMRTTTSTTQLNAVNASSATAELSSSSSSSSEFPLPVVMNIEPMQLKETVNGDGANGNNQSPSALESPPPHWAHPRRKLRDEASSSSSSAASLSTTTLGDIMSDSSLLVTAGSGCASSASSTSSSSSSLAATYGITHPLDRIALTANGNLQRLVSSYYDAPVSVVVDSCEKRPISVSSSTTTTISTSSSSSSSSSSSQPQMIWDRVVRLTIYNQTFCTATSEIIVYDAVCQQLVESGQVGLGQLFRYLDLLPTFWLHNAAPKKQGGFWRDYTLQCPELSCRIHEDFVPGMWEIPNKRTP